ncbi:MAG TPA: hypothetical protein VG253_19655 [Streptosporangiaceae bacterium]|jgi:hypothetical protein|nr:hypothetical protein [Streptosporangiaceae bacterium]
MAGESAVFIGRHEGVLVITINRWMRATRSVKPSPLAAGLEVLDGDSSLAGRVLTGISALGWT